MKKWIFAAVCAALVAGCTEVRLANGKYESALEGREDFAAVYGDLIFLRLRNAESDQADGGYWDWAGKFRIIDETGIELDMDRRTKRLWKFYYQLSVRGKDIVVEDLKAEKSFFLRLRPAAAPRRTGGSAGVYPAYR